MWAKALLLHEETCDADGARALPAVDVLGQRRQVGAKPTSLLEFTRLPKEIELLEKHLPVL